MEQQHGIEIQCPGRLYLSCGGKRGDTDPGKGPGRCAFGEHPTFMKMDIEGAETESLKGSRKIIERYRPKLAICIYHKPEDLFEIPILLREMRNDYRLLIRQYSDTRFETVCYAI